MLLIFYVIWLIRIQQDYKNVGILYTHYYGGFFLFTSFWTNSNDVYYNIILCIFKITIYYSQDAYYNHFW